MKKFTITQNDLTRFQKNLTLNENSALTVEKYTRDIKVFLSFIGSGTFDKRTVVDYKEWLGNNYKVTSANSMIGALNSLFKFLGAHELCIKQFKVQRQAYCSEDKELTRAEYVRLIRCAQNKKNQKLSLIIQTICSTGIRVSELKFITVEAVYQGEATVKLKGKTRNIFIIPELKTKLIKYIRDQNLTTGSVFLSKNGKPILRNNVWRDMKSLCEDACVSKTKVFPHNLRHLFARTFYGIEKDIAKLADILGHTNVNTTRIYIVTTGAEHKKKMQNMRLII